MRWARPDVKVDTPPVHMTLTVAGNIELSLRTRKMGPARFELATFAL